jgi:hemolysin III
MLRRIPEPTSGFTHLAAMCLAVIGLVWLIAVTHSEPTKMLSMLVYGLSLILLYAASSALHLIPGSERVRHLLRRFDHAAIYLLIAGTYTPFCYHFLTGGWRWGMLGVIWFAALVGIVYKLFFRWKKGFSTLAYVTMGWLGVIVAPVAIHLLPTGAILLILGGGLVYMAGAVIFALDKPNFHRHFNAHDLWHILVMGGSALHFAAIMLFVV